MKKPIPSPDQLSCMQDLVRELSQKKPNQSKLKQLAKQLGCASFTNNEDLMEKILMNYPQAISVKSKEKPLENELT